jgi:hypothetical protein
MSAIVDDKSCFKINEKHVTIFDGPPSPLRRWIHFDLDDGDFI